jgi:hypothetical protein
MPRRRLGPQSLRTMSQIKRANELAQSSGPLVADLYRAHAAACASRTGRRWHEKHADYEDDQGAGGVKK